MEERKSYFDIYKGMLIILVVMSHYTINAGREGIQSGFYTWLQNHNYVITCFFMPAFFLVTGYCSNFNKDFKPFLVSNAKSLLIPAFLLPPVPKIILSLWKHDISPILEIFTVRYITQCGFLWFLSALFLSKMIYWTLNRYLKSINVRLLICCALILLGLLCLQMCDVKDADYYNPFYYRNALVLTIFLCIGQCAETLNFKVNWIMSGISAIFFVEYMLLKRCSGLGVPGVTKNIYIGGLEYVIPFIVLALCGACIVMQVAKVINKNTFLEYLVVCNI